MRGGGEEVGRVCVWGGAGVAGESGFWDEDPGVDLEVFREAETRPGG